MWIILPEEAHIIISESKSFIGTKCSFLGNINVLIRAALSIPFHCLTTNPKHKGVHFLLDVLMAHLAAVFIGGAQQHVQKCPSFPLALVVFAV